MNRNFLNRKAPSIRLASVLMLAAATQACSPSSPMPKAPHYKAQSPIITQLKSTTRRAPLTAALNTEARQSLAAASDIAPADRALTTEVTLVKAEILGGREFLYGADLQYSSSHDEGMDLYNQSLALGHEIARFERFGNSLRILADQRHQYESDINHPARLIQELPIVGETDTTLTVRIDHASPTLVTVAGSPEAAPARTSWVRGIQYVEQGNYLLVQSTIETASGDIFEFHESLFPRESLVPETYQPIYNDPSLEPWAQRFRFLSQAAVFMDLPGLGRTRIAAANRYVISEDKPIEWYVTRNVPEAYIDMVKHGVEGWNRYSQQMWGKDFIRFAGHLPEGVAIGDPRFNVINWDSVSEAGAAYEMQASDPLTGIQSHSLIYLPNAWVNIGRGFWEKGQLSENNESTAREATPVERKFLGRAIRPNCRNKASARLPSPSQINAGLDPESFGKELLKGTLFHEVGHALGLDHNFKGSLSFEGADTAFTTSIMDYNQFHLEQAAFEGVDSSQGPLLEYDRQIISALYNQGDDITNDDDVVPACNDAEADYEEGMVDPLCLRYDAGSNPAERLAGTRNLIDSPDAVLDASVSLNTALSKILTKIETGALPEANNDFDTIEDRLARFVEQHKAHALGTVNFYFNSGAQSLAAMAVANAKTLLTNESDLAGVPELEVDWGNFLRRYDLQNMRRKVFETIQTTLSQEDLPASTLELISAVESVLLNRVNSELLDAGKSADEAAALTERLLDGVAEDFTAQLVRGKAGTSATSKTRKKLLGALTRREAVAFYFEAMEPENEDAPATAIDYEASVVGVLKKAVLHPFSPISAERDTAIHSLLTFRGTESGDAALEEALATIRAELKKARFGDEREALRSWVKQLQEVSGT